MALAMFHSSLNPSTSLFSRTHLPFSIPKDFSEEFLPSVHFRNKPFRKKRVRASVAEAPAVATTTRSSSSKDNKNLKILVAGGGIGGLVFALAAKKKGFDVLVFEKDLSAIRGEGQYRGPIQIQSNALGALEAIDMEVADEVMKVRCITGDRINGLVDGISGSCQHSMKASLLALIKLYIVKTLFSYDEECGKDNPKHNNEMEKQFMDHSRTPPYHADQGTTGHAGEW